MQVRDNDSQLLYGLFQSICGWALEKGYRDISTMKTLLKLAMVDVCRQKHSSKSPSAIQLSVVADLGISLRNVQYSLKALEGQNDISGGFIKIRQIQREILILLSHCPQTLEQILAEVSFLIHAPYDLQKRTLRMVLRDLEQKGIIESESEGAQLTYRTAESHIDLYNPADLPTRLSGLLSHIDAYNNTIGEPLFSIFHLHPDQAEDLQTALNEFLRGTGNAYEMECRETESVTKPYYFYLGCAPVQRGREPCGISEAMLEVIQARFKEPDSPTLAKTHWYHLTPGIAQTVFNEVCDFLKREGTSAGKNANKNETIPFAFYFGLADNHVKKTTEGMIS